jgi:hypothetical protein
LPRKTLASMEKPTNATLISASNCRSDSWGSDCTRIALAAQLVLGCKPSTWKAAALAAY